MKTAATNKKIRELITLIRDKKLSPRPDFQRRLVWGTDDKNRFIDTILNGFPFPEIFIADGKVNLDTGDGIQVLVDGQQRVTTVYEYFTNSPKLKLKSVPPYSKLDESKQREFLNYDVAVRDLGSVTQEQIIEVFKRINETSYPLNPMELNNAVYAGALKQFAEKISELEFFEMHKIFNAQDYRRMGDIKYVLSIICTMLVGYFNREEDVQSLLEKFNDEFNYSEEVESRIVAVLKYLDQLALDKSLRLWKKVDLFTAIIEIDSIKIENLPDATVFKTRLVDFYYQVDLARTEGKSVDAKNYFIAAVQGTNDKQNRILRGDILRQVILTGSFE